MSDKRSFRSRGLRSRHGRADARGLGARARAQGDRNAPIDAPATARGNPALALSVHPLPVPDPFVMNRSVAHLSLQVLGVLPDELVGVDILHRLWRILGLFRHRYRFSLLLWLAALLNSSSMLPHTQDGPRASLRVGVVWWLACRNRLLCHRIWEIGLAAAEKREKKEWKKISQSRKSGETHPFSIACPPG